MSSIRPLVPLLIAAGILLGGNGMQGTLIALRGAQEGFSPATIGFIGTAYFGGFLLGCIAITRIMKAVGHVRSFAALAAIASAGTLLLVLVIDPIMWSAMRFASGFCFAGLFTIMESWLNSGVANRDRARVLALLPHHRHRLGHRRAVHDPGLRRRRLHHLRDHVDHDHACRWCRCRSATAPIRRRRRRSSSTLARVWRISPLGCIGCIAVGLTNSAFRTLSPGLCRGDRHVGRRCRHVCQRRHHRRRAHPISARATLSDRWDRRMVLLVSTFCAMLCALALVFLAGSDAIANFVIVFIFGCFAMPLFSLSAAHANDRAGKGEFVRHQRGADAVLFLRCDWRPVRGILVDGERSGRRRCSASRAAVYAAFILIILYRMRARGSVPAGERGRFTRLLQDLDHLLAARPPHRRGRQVPQAAVNNGTAGLTERVCG